MVFKPFAAADGRVRDLAGIVEGQGGDVNAFTSHDETVFHATAPADGITEVLEVMLDAVVDRRFDAAILEREQEVVIEEIHQYQDDPAARSVQLLMADLYAGHAYARPVLGEIDEVRSLTPASLHGWLRRQLRGERLLLVAVGPVDAEAIISLARARLGTLPAAKTPRPSRRPPPPAEPRVRVERADVQEVYLRLGWIGGTALDAEGVALDVAAIALGQGESSRLAVDVRRRARLVSDAYAGYVAGVAGGTFLISAQAEAAEAEAAAIALLDAVEALTKLPLEHGELARARALLHSSLVYRRETVQGQAHALGYYSSLACLSSEPDLDLEARLFHMLTALDPEAVRLACARHLAPERAAITILLPRDRFDGRQAKRLADNLRARCRGEQPRGRAQGRGKSRKRGFAAPVRDAKGTWHSRHRSGLRLVARPDASVPVVGGWLVWPGGLRVESAREAGISSLTATLLNRGSSSRDGDALAREIEGMAAVLDGFSGHNSMGMQTECLSADLPTVLARALECVTDAGFANAEIDEARRVTLADLEADLDDPGHLAYRQMLASLYGRHPLGRDLRGTPASLARMDHRLIAHNWAQHYPLHRAVLALAGDVDLPSLCEELDQLLATLSDLGADQGKSAGAPSWPGGPPRWPKRPVERVLQRDREQGQLVIGFPGLRMDDPEVAALDVLCAVLGGQAGRLFEALRERQGLVYQVGANASEHVDGGHLVFYAAASQDKLEATRRAMVAEFTRVVDEIIGADELDRARRWLLGQFESSMQRRSRVASRLVFAEVYGLGRNHYLDYPERIMAVGREQLQALARRLIDPRRQVSVRVSAKG